MPEKPPSCVLLAERHHGLSEGVRGLLETAFDSVVMVADEASLLQAASQLQPEVAVVDLSLSRDTSLAWLREVRRRCPGIKLTVISVHDEETVRNLALEAGADAFVLKRAIATDLLPAIEQLGHAREDGCTRQEDVERGSKRATPLGPAGATGTDPPDPSHARRPAGQ